MLANNISSAGVSASEIPDGFSLADPNSGGIGGGGGARDPAAEEQAQRQVQRDAILEQAMTPDALARLRRVKVGRKNESEWSFVIGDANVVDFVYTGMNLVWHK